MKKLFSLNVAVLISVSVIVGLGYFMYALHERREYRSKIASLAIELGDHQTTIGELYRLLRQPSFQGLELREDSPNKWTVETPLEFGAKNWILFLELKDSKVVAIRVRTPDAPNKRPDNAPPDKRS